MLLFFLDDLPSVGKRVCMLKVLIDLFFCHLDFKQALIYCLADLMIMHDDHCVVADVDRL